MNVTLIGVGAGYSYVVSGPTHQCYEDLTLMRALPNIAVYSPADHVTAAALFDPCVSNKGIKYLRLDAQVLPILYDTIQPDLGRGFNIQRKGEKICLLATGYMVHTALQVAEQLGLKGLSVGVVDLFDISRFSADALEELLSSYEALITLEEGFRGRGGVDAMMFEFIARRRLSLRMLNFGVEGTYRFELGSRAELHEQVGIGVDVVTRDIMKFVTAFPTRCLQDR
jgi:transketolase